MKLYMFRTVPLSIIRSYSLRTQQWYMVYRQLSSRIRMEHSILILLLESCLYDTYDGQRNCPKHVEFRSKINLRN
jgi:phosphatidylinositol kinase/protein kinase (PI-3  family)